MIDLRNQLISVIGLGKSGFESARFLKSRGSDVFVTESARSADLERKASELGRLGIRVELGPHDYAQLLKSKIVVISPGISPKSEIYQKIIQANIPLWSEIELAYRFCPSPIIAVTGTNGKTTVTTLITQLLKDQKVRAVSCGNIGNPFIGEVDRLTPDQYVVLEVSSFQLENTEEFKPRVGVLLNLTDNHFDWHGTFEHYATAKFKLFQNQTKNEFAIINKADLESQKRVGTIKSSVRYFDSGPLNNPNYSACLSVVDALGLDVNRALSVLSNFKGIEHRMERVESSDGIAYINDSKSTTIASLKWAMERMQTPAILIAGGRHKGGDFSQIRSCLKAHAKYVVLIGEAQSEMEAAFRGVVQISKAPSLKAAIRTARSVSTPGDTILFSPACASFDMFKNYEDRGRQFKQLIVEMQTDGKVANHSRGECV